MGIIQATKFSFLRLQNYLLLNAGNFGLFVVACLVLRVSFSLHFLVAYLLFLVANVVGVVIMSVLFIGSST